MKLGWAELAAMCVLAACGDGGGGGSRSFDTPWRSGERVRAVLASSTDGFSTRVGWRDVELDLDCRAGPFSPFCGAVEADAELGFEIYSDPACSQPALVLLDGRNQQGYASLQRFGEEPRAFRLLGSLFDYFVADSSGCIPGSGIEAYAAVELTDGELARWRPAELEGVYETDDGAFDIIVFGEERIEDAATRLRTRFAETGQLRAAVGIHDSERGSKCVIVETSGGVHRCVPPQIPAGQFFVRPMHRDPACADEPVTVSAYLGAVLQQVDGVVSEIEEYATFDPGPFYQDQEGDCVASAFEEHYTGAAVPIDAYASVTFSVE